MDTWINLSDAEANTLIRRLRWGGLSSKKRNLLLNRAPNLSEMEMMFSHAGATVVPFKHYKTTHGESWLTYIPGRLVDPITLLARLFGRSVGTTYGMNFNENGRLVSITARAY
jgi:hypothetical protein